ncbi:MAG: ATP-binding protein, partial [Gaiellaceae bacterium]
VFEDLHWADDALLDFVDHLVEWSAGVALLVLCSARPELLERRPDWGGGKLNALTLALSPLADDDAARVIAAVLEQAVLPAETQLTLLERVGGNPLFAEQYARLYLEHGSVDDLALPETIQGIIAARLDALPGAEKALLQDAAVLGKVFWAGALGEHEHRDALLHSLERKEFIRRERRPSISGEAELSFRHVLVRDVAYSQIPRAARGEKHERASTWIESLGRQDDHAELVAHHCLEALALARASGRDDGALAARAASAARAAGDRARSLSAHAAAVGYFEQALELTPADDPSHPHLLLSLGEARFMMGSGDLTVLEQAVVGFLEHSNYERAAEAERLLFRRDWFGGQTDSSLAHLHRALELVADAPPSRTKADVLAQAARNATISGDAEGALRIGQEALELAESLGLDDVRAAVSATFGLARTGMGDWDGIEDLEQALELAKTTDLPGLQINIANNLAEVYHRSGDVTRARGLFEAAHQTAARFGIRSGSRWSKAHLLEFAFIAGDWDEAAGAADAFLRESERTPHYLDASVLSVRAQIGLARGDLATALEDSERCLTLAREAKDGQLLHPALFRRASVLLHADRRREAEELVDELLLDGSGFWPDAQPEAPWLLGKLERTIAESELTRGLRTPWLEALEAGFAGDWHRAAEIYAALPHPTAEAFARLRAAEAFLAAGRGAEADAQLERALEFYRAVGATQSVREAEALLAKIA